MGYGAEFEFLAGHRALDFANTVHCHGFADPRDDLRGWEDLLRWGRQAGFLSRKDLRLCLGHADRSVQFDNALQLRETIFQLFSRIAAGKTIPPGLLSALNQEVRRAWSKLVVAPSGANSYALALTGAGDPVERMLDELTRGAIDLLTSGNLDRVRQCASDTCSWLFLDTSRNGKRRWCDMQACGNRAKVRRFREREMG